MTGYKLVAPKMKSPGHPPSDLVRKILDIDVLPMRGIQQLNCGKGARLFYTQRLLKVKTAVYSYLS